MVVDVVVVDDVVDVVVKINLFVDFDSFDCCCCCCS